jgi:hypothetical protein
LSIRLLTIEGVFNNRLLICDIFFSIGITLNKGAGFVSMEVQEQLTKRCTATTTANNFKLAYSGYLNIARLFRVKVFTSFP